MPHIFLCIRSEKMGTEWEMWKRITVKSSLSIFIPHQTFPLSLSWNISRKSLLIRFSDSNIFFLSLRHWIYIIIDFTHLEREGGMRCEWLVRIFIVIEKGLWNVEFRKELKSIWGTFLNWVKLSHVYGQQLKKFWQVSMYL